MNVWLCDEEPKSNLQRRAEYALKKALLDLAKFRLWRSEPEDGPEETLLDMYEGRAPNNQSR